MKISKQSIIVFTVLYLVRPFSVSAQEIYRLTVSQDGEADYTSIQQTVDAGKDFPDERISFADSALRNFVAFSAGGNRVASWLLDSLT